MSIALPYAHVCWDGACPISEQFGDRYFSNEDGAAESRHVFLAHTDIVRRWSESSNHVIAELGFGSALNFLLVLEAWRASAPPSARLHYYSFEAFPLAPADIARALAPWPALADDRETLLAQYPLPLRGVHRLSFADGRIQLSLVLGDAREQLAAISFSADTWFLDGFAPDRNPEMWGDVILDAIHIHSAPGTRFSTFSSAGAVRRGLGARGFSVERFKGYGSKRESLCGTLQSAAPERKASAPWFRIPGRKTAPSSAVVIGAGLGGCSVAHALAERGVTVRLIERGPAPASGASGNPAALLIPYVTSPPTRASRFYLAAYQHALRLIERLERKGGGEIVRGRGVLHLLSAQRLKRLWSEIAELGFPAALVRAIEAEECSEIAGIPLGRALHYPTAAWISPAALCRALVADNKHILPQFDAAVARLERRRDHWEACDESGGVLGAGEIVVVANAFECASLAPTNWLAVEPIRGEVAMARPSPQSEALRCAISLDGYVLPAHAGTHMIGATYEHGCSDPHPDQEKQRALVRRAARTIDCLSNIDLTSLEGRVSFRTSTHDRLPYIGFLPEIEGFREAYRELWKGLPEDRYPDAPYHDDAFVTVGHGSRGMLSCILAAEIVASMACGEPAPLEDDLLEALNPARLLVKRMKQPLRSA